MSLIALSKIWVEPRADLHPTAMRDEQIITFSQFRNDVTKLAYWLKNCKRAALICTDSYYFLVGMFALLEIGAEIVLPANNHPAMLAKLNSNYDIIVDDYFIVQACDEEKVSDVCNDKLDTSSLSFKFFTSGTTGEAKEIRKSLQMLENEISILHKRFGRELGQGIVFATVPHHHLYGMIFKLLLPLSSGKMFCANTHTFWEMLFLANTANATIITSPSHLQNLGGMEKLPANKRPIIVFSAGALLNFAASEQSREILGCTPTEIFGSTETGAIATRCENEFWQALPDISIECDQNNQMIVRSPSIDRQAFVSNDIIELVANGFRFLGRSDRIAKIGGKRISLVEVENALHNLAFVKEAVAIILGKNSPQLAAILVLYPEGIFALEKEGKFRFVRKLRQKLAKTQEVMAIPRRWRFVEALPIQGIGKVCMTELQKLFEENS